MIKQLPGMALVTTTILAISALAYAVEQKTVFTTSDLEYRSGTGKERCQEKCRGKSVPDLNGLMTEGWRVVNSSPKKLVAEDYLYVPCSSCQPHGCICIGTEHVLRRDTPPPAKIVIPVSELDALKMENARLKEELDRLKQENGKLRDSTGMAGKAGVERPR